MNVSSDEFPTESSVFMKHNDCIFFKMCVYFLNKLFWCCPFIEDFLIIYKNLEPATLYDVLYILCSLVNSVT